MRSALLCALMFLAPHCYSHEKAKIGDCDTTYRTIEANELVVLGIPKPVKKRLCYRDDSGEYQLYLIEKQDNVLHDKGFASSIEAHLVKKGVEGGYTKQWTIRDHAEDEEAGMYFVGEEIEFPDIEGNKIVSPIIVYKFVARDYKGEPDYESFSGRLKIITFYKGTKIAIRAKTGTLDNERGTRASKSFFELPKQVQIYLVHKMQRMYKDHIFGFDNSYEFFPVKEKN